MTGQNGRDKGAEKLTTRAKILSSSRVVMKQKWGIFPDKCGKAPHD